MRLRIAGRSRLLHGNPAIMNLSRKSLCGRGAAASGHPEMNRSNQRAGRRIGIGMRRAGGVALTRFAASGAVALACGLIAGCQPAAPAAAKADASAKPAAPSKVTGTAKKEADLAKLELTEQAEKRLGVEA